jgi:Flp pilus assembly protein TadG
LVELAIILFVLFAIVFGCVDFGRFATTFIAVTNAAREGANFGSTHPFTDGTRELWKQQIHTAVANEMIGIPSFSLDKLTVAEPTVVTASETSRVRVQVSYPFEPFVPWLIIPSRLDVSRTAEMPVAR